MKDQDYNAAKDQMTKEAAKRDAERRAQIQAMPPGKQKDLLMKMQTFVAKDKAESTGETKSTEEKK
jgi:hypothetical protein